MRERSSGETPSPFRSMGHFPSALDRKKGFSLAVLSAHAMWLYKESQLGEQGWEVGGDEKEGEEQDFRHKLYPIVVGASFSILAPVPSLQLSVEAIPRADLEHKKGEKREAHPHLGHPPGLHPPQRAASYPCRALCRVRVVAVRMEEGA